MDHGSKFVWMNCDENDEEEVQVDDVSSNLWEPDVAVHHSSSSAIPAPPAPSIPQGPQILKTRRNLKVKKADTNVISVNLGSLENGVTLSTGDPIFCSSCKAVLSNESKVTKKEDSTSMKEEGESVGSHIWDCEFCNTRNEINCDPEEIPKDQSVDYITGSPSESVTSADEKLIVFCLDISGSMGISYEIEGKVNLKGSEKIEKLSSLNTERNAYGQMAEQWLPNERRDVTYVTRLQCVQAAISAEIERMYKENPNYKIAIVSFNNEVTLIGDGSSSPTIIAGDKLHSYDDLLHIGKSFQAPRKVKESKATLLQKLFSLEENGSTALGPALVVALGMAGGTPGSKIVVCTDGLSNTGLGSLDDLADDEAKSAVSTFYESLGLTAKSAGVNMSVISIKGSDCSLENLGQLAELTAGSVDRVDPLEITKNFQSIMSLPVLATHVVATMLLHNGLFIKDEADTKSIEVREIGNVTRETGITFEYGVRRNLKKESFAHLTSLPFQLQITYTRLDGMKCLRTITKTTPITFDRRQAEETANIAVLGMNAVQQSAKMAARGEYSQARLYNLGNKAMLERAAVTGPQQAQYSKWASYGRKLEEELSTVQRQEIEQDAYMSDDEEEEEMGEIGEMMEVEGGNEEKKEKEGAKKGSSMKKKMEKLVKRKNKRNDSTSAMLYSMKSTNHNAFM